MNTPYFSICIPAYQAKKYIQQTLLSIRSQDFPHWELIIVEDGSTDPVKNLVEEFSATVEQRVTYIASLKNQGLPVCRNTGFEIASCDWIALMDADDLWEANHLSSLWECQIKTNSLLIHSSSQAFDSESGKHLELRASTPGFSLDPAPPLYKGDLIIQPSSVIFSKNLLSRFGGFNASYPICNDLEFWLRLATRGVPFHSTGQATCLYRKHSDSLSSKAANLIAEVARIRRDYKSMVKISSSESKRLIFDSYCDAARIIRRTNPAQAGRWALQGALARLGW